MPTGYTYNIGKGINFRTFALQCARAFGACMMQRDDEPIDMPKKQKISSCYKNKIANCKKEIVKIKTMTDKQCEKKAIEQMEKTKKDNIKKIKEADELKSKYMEMLNKVKDWIPPSTDHQELKNFMISQITESIPFDCNYYLENEIEITGEDWKLEKIESLEEDIEYYEINYEKEVTRVAKANVWIKQLYASLDNNEFIK